MKKCSLLLAAAMIVFSAANAFAQATASGTILGTVFDKSQAVVVGADVVLTSKATGMARTATTSDTGTYRFDLIPAGAYTVKVSKQGFSSVVLNVELLVAQTATANATLQPGSVAETVEVTAAAPLVDLEKTSVGQAVTPAEVEQLPMVGHDAADLAYLVPGVKATDSYDPTKNRYAVISVNGEGGRNVNVTVNGVDNKDNTVGGPVMQVPMEAVQEYHISTQRFSAENGRSEGAAINMITKSGSNAYHGSVFGYFREGTLDAAQKVANGVGGYELQNPDYSRQFFGGSIGGPFKKDKLFGFFAIERQRESQGQAVTPNSYDELVTALQNMPGPYLPEPATVIPRPFYETRYNGRMDWTINKKNTAYISYSSQANNSLNDQSDATMDLTEGNFTLNHLQVANLTLTSAVSNTTVNQLTLGFQYWNNLIDSNVSSPLVVFNNASFGTNTNVPQQSFQRKWQFKDDFSKTIGKHTLTTGLDFIHTPVQGGFFKYSSTLEIDFNDDPSTIVNDHTAYPDGFSTPGAVVGMTIANGDPKFLVSTKQFGLYLQDNWKATPHLTVNLGLRWDRDFNFFGTSLIKQSRSYQELVALHGSAACDAACQAIIGPYVSKIPQDDTKDFSPRVGFAYDLTGNGKHVVRGGFGLYYGNTFQNIPLFMEQQANPTIFQTLFLLDDPAQIVPGATNAQFPNGIPLGDWRYGIDPMPTIAAPSSQLSDGSTGRVMSPNYRNPVTEEFNVGYTWAVDANSVFEAEYTHVLSLHENKTINIIQNLPVGGVCCTSPLHDAFVGAGLPELASIRDEQSIGRSHYDGMNLSFRRRMAHHFALNANYTLSWANSFGGGGTSFRNYTKYAYAPFASYNWGPSPNDERHHLTVYGTFELPKGLQLSPIMQFGTARPYDLTNSYNTLVTGGGVGTAVLVPTNDTTNYLYGPTYISNVIATRDPNLETATQARNRARQDLQMCFFNGQCTIAKYDPLRGDPFFQMDLKLAKNVKLGERMNVQFIAQAFNLTNRANYGNNYSGNVGSSTAAGSQAPTFMHPQGFINPSSTIVPRSLWSEFGVRFTF